MSIALRPGQTFAVIPDADRGMDAPRTFHVRAITGAEAMDVSDSLDRLKDAGGGRAALMSAYATAASLLGGWDNLPEPFDPATAASVLARHTTFLEARDLIRAALAGMSEDQRGK